MKDGELLRTYIREALQLELRLDPHMMSMLRGSDLQHDDEPDSLEAERIVDDWLEGYEMETGKPASPHHRVRVHRYAARKWPILIRRFRGNTQAARQTLYNLLDMKSSEEKAGR